MGSFENIKAGFERVGEKLKALTLKVPEIYHLPSDVYPAPTANVDFTVGSIPDSDFIAGKLYELEFAFRIQQPPAVGGATVVSTVLFKVKKGSFLLYQSAAISPAFNSNVGFHGKMSLFCRFANDIVCTNRHTTCTAGTANMNAATSDHIGVQVFSPPALTNQPLLIQVLVTNKTTNITFALHQLKLKRVILPVV